MGCGDHAHINADLTGSTHRQNATLLQDTQKLDLHVHGQVTDLIQKQGATMSQLKTPQAISNSACEGPLPVTKQLTFDQLTRNRATIDGHKGTAGPWTLSMQGLRHQLFARTAFTCDQSRR